MYGKIFSRMYQGSMVGAGSHVFAVWGYCISNADPESHLVDLNPILLSAIIGDSKERIQQAIDYLSQPDEHSHNKEHEGRRILKTSGFEYFLVSHEQYRNICNNEELRQYFREKKREQRSMSKTVKDNLGLSQDPASASVSVYESTSKGDARGAADRSAGGWTLDECRRAAESIGMPPDMVAAFYHHYDAQGWVRGNGQAIRSLSSALASWKASQAQREAEGKPVKEYQGRV